MYAVEALWMKIETTFSLVFSSAVFHVNTVTVGVEWRWCWSQCFIKWSVFVSRASVSHPGCGFPLASQWMTMFSRGSTMYSFGDWWVIVGGCGTAGHMTRVSLDTANQRTHTHTAARRICRHAKQDETHINLRHHMHSNALLSFM